MNAVGVSWRAFTVGEADTDKTPSERTERYAMKRTEAAWGRRAKESSCNCYLRQVLWMLPLKTVWLGSFYTFICRYFSYQRRSQIWSWVDVVVLNRSTKNTLWQRTDFEPVNAMGYRPNKHHFLSKRRGSRNVGQSEKKGQTALYISLAISQVSIYEMNSYLPSNKLAGAPTRAICRVAVRKRKDAVAGEKA